MLAKVEITGGGRCNLTNSFQGNRRHEPWGMSWEGTLGNLELSAAPIRNYSIFDLKFLAHPEHGVIADEPYITT